MISYLIMFLIFAGLAIAILSIPPFRELRANLRWQYLNIRYERACLMLIWMESTGSEAADIRAQKLKIDKVYGKICRCRAVRA